MKKTERKFKTEKLKCCRLGLIDPVNGRYCQVQTTVRASYHRLKQNSTFKQEMANFWNIRRCVHTAFVMEPSMWHFRAIPWKTAYGSQEIESVCPKTRKTMDGTKTNYILVRNESATYLTTPKRYHSLSPKPTKFPIGTILIKKKKKHTKRETRTKTYQHIKT
jgi:hypothetical protein